MTPIPDLIPLHTGRPGLRTMLQVIVSASADQRDQVPSSLPSLPSVKPPSDPTGAQISSPSSPLSPVKSGPDLIRDNSCNSCQPGSDPIRDNSCNSCLDFISSDSTLDRYGEIITPAGWNLTNYRRNPVFQNAHQYGDIIFTLGRALITEVRQVGTSRRDVLFQRIQFATDANPLAKIAHALYAGKFLNAVSVGFIPRRWEDGSESSSSSFSSSSSIQRFRLRGRGRGGGRLDWNVHRSSAPGLGANECVPSGKWCKSTAFRQFGMG